MAIWPDISNFVLHVGLMILSGPNENLVIPRILGPAKHWPDSSQGVSIECILLNVCS